VEPRHHRPVMAEVAGEVHDAHAGVALVERYRDVERAVRRAVVHEHDLVVRRQLAGGAARPLVERGQEGLRPVERGHDGQPHEAQNLSRWSRAAGPTESSRSSTLTWWSNGGWSCGDSH